MNHVILFESRDFGGSHKHVFAAVPQGWVQRANILHCGYWWDVGRCDRGVRDSWGSIPDVPIVVCSKRALVIRWG